MGDGWDISPSYICTEAWPQYGEWLLPSILRSLSLFLEKKQKEVTFSSATSFLPSFHPLPAAEERKDSRARTRFVSCSVPAEVTALA